MPGGVPLATCALPVGMFYLLTYLLAACDDDGNGEVNYKEFVDALARDTVAPAAMGKRDMQAKEAMGQDDVEVLSEHIKRRPKKNERFSLNAEVL